jgi:hypothetical protein
VKKGDYMRRSLALLVLAAILLCGPRALAYLDSTGSFRCPNGAIISINDKLVDVMMRCDPPTSVTTRLLTRSVGYVYTAVGSAPYFETIEREEWVYNQGPASFVYFLTFDNGILTRIQSGGYGR